MIRKVAEYKPKDHRVVYYVGPSPRAFTGKCIALTANAARRAWARVSLVGTSAWDGFLGRGAWIG